MYSNKAYHILHKILVDNEYRFNPHIDGFIPRCDYQKIIELISADEELIKILKDGRKSDIISTGDEVYCGFHDEGDVRVKIIKRKYEKNIYYYKVKRLDQPMTSHWWIPECNLTKRGLK